MLHPTRVLQGFKEECQCRLCEPHPAKMSGDSGDRSFPSSQRFLSAVALLNATEPRTLGQIAPRIIARMGHNTATLFNIDETIQIVELVPHVPVAAEQRRCKWLHGHFDSEPAAPHYGRHYYDHAWAACGDCR